MRKNLRKELIIVRNIPLLALKSLKSNEFDKNLKKFWEFPKRDVRVSFGDDNLEREEKARKLIGDRGVVRNVIELNRYNDKFELDSKFGVWNLIQARLNFFLLVRSRL